MQIGQGRGWGLRSSLSNPIVISNRDLGNFVTRVEYDGDKGEKKDTVWKWFLQPLVPTGPDTSYCQLYIFNFLFFCEYNPTKRYSNLVSSSVSISGNHILLCLCVDCVNRPGC